MAWVKALQLQTQLRAHNAQASRAATKRDPNRTLNAVCNETLAVA